MKKKADSFRDYVEEQLGPGMSFRAMFGGVGISRGEAFFGILFKGRLYFRTGPHSRAKYVAQGSKPFKPSARQTLKSYYEVPADILENADTLRAWALEAASR
jgi:DNA transformation protein and related proteins